MLWRLRVEVVRGGLREEASTFGADVGDFNLAASFGREGLTGSGLVAGSSTKRCPVLVQVPKGVFSDSSLKNGLSRTLGDSPVWERVRMGLIRARMDADEAASDSQDGDEGEPNAGRS